MTWLDLTLPAPAENLAADEALLDDCEAGRRDGDVLRFWAPADYFVVVGYANPVATEVNVAACREQGVPIFRRCSGGGTVLQGPGCLNYSLVLKIEARGPLKTIADANCFIMERNRAALEASRPVRNPPSAVTVEGHTDLALGRLKFSGNAQRRRKKFLLFHGTFLLHFDLARMASLLPLPSRQPEYRQNRGHRDFLTNFGVDAEAVKQALRDAWQAGDAAETLPREAIATLARDKYVTIGWNFKF